MRILIKGGVWKNSEDEILKAAVMKYGKAQWARVASLLSRKSAKQCKARWYEWLDPSIKKTEWSREEEEKLLHLAKLMPNQWRTIAPIVGRTAGQCMEHYERLLDQAQAEGEGEGGENVTEEARRLRPGEIDPAPEMKPARPDPIDMDDDEKEMLSEARARLANTKGKKAKRKARERMLEDSRRLALLQKRRELKAAGIQSKLGTKKRNFVDYAKEIPFQKLAPVGFYDVSDENEKSRKMELDPKKHGLELQKLEGQREKDEEERQRQRDKKLMKDMFKNNAPLAIQRVTEQTDPISLRRRLPLDLPAPQVTDNDLEEIVKLGKAGLMGPPEGLPSNFSATNTLVNDYSQVFKPSATPLRTPQHEDHIMQEARNLRALSKMTPLMMQQSDIEDLPDLAGGTGFDGMAPRKQHLSTPNPLVANTPGRQAMSGGSVIGSGMSVLSTPMGRGISNIPYGHAGSNSSGMSVAGGASSVMIRDSFGLNASQPGDDTFSVGDMSSIVTHSRVDKHRNKFAQQSILSQLSELPEPEYTYDVALPGAMDADEDDEDDIAYSAEAQLRQAGKPEDRAEVEERLKQQRYEAEQAELRRRSTVMKRNLPRPALPSPAWLQSTSATAVNTEASPDAPAAKRARTSKQTSSTAQSILPEQKLIIEEVYHLIAYEDRKYPPAFAAGLIFSETESLSSTIPPRFRREPERFEDAQLSAAEALIRSETLKRFNAMDASQLTAAVDAIASLQESLLYIPSEQGAAYPGHYISQPSKSQSLQALKTEFEYLCKQFDHNQQEIKSHHSKYRKQHATAELQQKQLLADLRQRQLDFQQYSTDLENVQAAKSFEQRAAQLRLDRALEETLVAERLEKECQQQYADLVAYARNHDIAL